MTDAEMSTLIRRLARPHPSGGFVIERAAILATGQDSPEILDWILSHSGAPEMPAERSQGLHGSRVSGLARSAASSKPTRFVLPAAALG